MKNALRNQILLLGLFSMFLNYLIGSDRMQNAIQVKDDTETFIKSSDSIKKIRNIIYNKAFIDTTREAVKQAERYARIFAKRGEEEQNDTIGYHANYYLAYIYFGQCNYKDAIVYSRKTIRFANTIGKHKNAYAMLLLEGGSYFSIGDYHNAIKAYLKAKEVAVRYQLKYEEVYCLINIGNCRVKIERYKDALQVFENILVLLERKEYQNIEGYTTTKLAALLGKGACQSYLGQFEEAIATNKEGIQRSRNLEIWDMQSEFFINLGKQYMLLQKFDVSLDFLEKGITLEKQFKSETHFNFLLGSFYKAKCLHGLGKVDEALGLMEKNFQLLQEDHKTENEVVEMYKFAIQIAEERKLTDTKIRFSDSLRNIQTLRYKNQLQARELLYDSDLNALRGENRKLSEANSTIGKKSKYLIILVLVFGCLLSGFIFYYFLNSKKNKNRFRELMAQLEQAETEKSNNISQEINLVQQNLDSEESVAPMLQQSPVIDKKAKEILAKLDELNGSGFFISKDCSLYTTAKKINTNTTYLSKTINTHKKQSFNDYVNDIRIQFALKNIKNDPKFRSYTIQAIAEELGYKSVNTFIKAFKNQTGLSPSYYIKELSK